MVIPWYETDGTQTHEQSGEGGDKTTTASFARNRGFFARALGRPVSP